MQNYVQVMKNYAKYSLQSLPTERYIDTASLSTESLSKLQTILNLIVENYGWN